MASTLLLLLSSAAASVAAPHHEMATAPVFELSAPASTAGASIEHSPRFSSFSFEPAFWVEFVGKAGEPNELVFDLLSHIIERGGQPIMRPGGISMDSLIFDPNGGDPERTMGDDGEVYRTTVGPAYFESWSHFPDEMSFISTLNLGNDSLQIASDMAVASAKYQAERIKFFEVGNEPNNYDDHRWGDETQAYVDQWKNWTASIDDAVDEVSKGSGGFESRRWWASSATTDETSLGVRPVDVIPAGIDSEHQVGEFSIHSYVYSTCSSSDADEATIENLLNHTQIVTFADEEVVPSARAAQEHGGEWIMGEFNSIACSGKPNVSDTFTQALWVIDTELAYAVRNASSVHLHQGATLVLQSGEQTNTPGFSTYDFVYPRDSEKYGEARALPGYSALLFVTEVFAQPGTRIQPLQAPEGVDPDHFSGYVAYEGDRPTKLILLNMNLYYSGSEDDHSIALDLSSYTQKGCSIPFKRLTAPSVDETDSGQTSWAGQSFKYGDASGKVELEQLSEDSIVEIRGSEAVLVFLDDDSVYGL